LQAVATEELGVLGVIVGDLYIQTLSVSSLLC
jgi:hypothetical protein